MQQQAFLMHLKPGVEAEYRHRHATIWPELKAALAEAGIRDYSIFLDPENGNLFAVQRLTDDNHATALPDLPVMRKWWDSMAHLMDVDSGNKPMEKALTPMFHMD